MAIQPTDEIALEQQPTQPIEMEAQAAEELSTLLLAVVEKPPEQQPTQPMEMRAPTLLLTAVAESLEQQRTQPNRQGEASLAPTQVAESLAQQPTQPMETKALAVDELATLSLAVVEQAPEQQPTQPIETKAQEQDKLSTLPLAVVARAALKKWLEQPTQAINTESPEQDKLLTLPLAVVARAALRKWLEQQPTQPMTLQRSVSKLRWMIPFLLCVLLMGGVLTGSATLKSWLTHGKTPFVIQSQRAYAHSTQVFSTTHSFMDAMMHKEWTKMWSMLSPDAQQLYQGEQDFVRFEQAKFGSLTFVSYKASAAQQVQPWLDPDTTQVYPVATVQKISLEAIAPPGLLTDPSNMALSKGLFHDTLFAMTLNQGKWEVVVAGPADIDAPILVPASTPKVQLLVPIFMYHHVSNAPAYNALDYNLTVTTTDFDAQLSWLQLQGYHSINMTELFDALYYGKALPAHPMILTFDDGYKDAYTDTLPTLLAHHYRGVFFIITGMIGGHYLTWEQVSILEQSGMQIASHTIHHVNIGQPPYYTTTQKELTLSKATLEGRLGEPIQFFCYPTGEPFHHDTYAEQQLVLADLLKDGYVGATLDPFSFDSAIQNAQTPYQLPRIRVSGGESLDAFSGILNFTLQADTRKLAQATTTS
jgi:peptidoglycan/xylan/chitin deacetylase (PgdA/CDA1 family)